MKLLKAVLIISIQTSIMLFLANLLFFPAMAFAFQGFMTSKQGASSVKSLDILVRDLDNRSFDVTLFIENKNTTPLCLQGIKMELQQTVPKATTNSVPMPGFNGPRKSSTSSGTHLLNIRNPGHLIDLAGRQKAKWNLQNAVWEIVWNQDDPCGSIICGLELLENIARNDKGSKLPKGRVYLKFPLWHAEKLAQYQIRKAQTEEAAAQHIQDRDSELAKMQETSNLFSKAMHYSNARHHFELFTLTPVAQMSRVPGPDQVLPIADDFFLAKDSGSIWIKTAGMRQQIQYGKALIKFLEKDSEQEAKAATRTSGRPIPPPNRLSKYLSP